MSERRIVYSVTAAIPDQATAREYLAWLRGGHIGDVVRAGATSGMAISLDPTESAAVPAHRVVAQYQFRNRAAFDAYIRDHAPTLREDGRRRFPPERGITWTREVGEIEE